MDNNQYTYEVQTNQNEQSIFFHNEQAQWMRNYELPHPKPQGKKRRRSEDSVDWPEQKPRRRDSCCIKCREMTGTLEGLRALVGDGYQHYSYYQVQQAAEMGCQLCDLIWTFVEGADWARDWIFDDCESTVVTDDKVVVRAVSDEDTDSLCSASTSTTEVGDEELTKARVALEKSKGIIDPGFRISNLRIDIPTDNDVIDYDAPLLHLVAFEDNPAAKYVPGRWQAKTLTPAVVTEVMDWLNECQETHESCMKHRLQALPRRVIDVGSPDNSADMPRLHVSRDGEKGEYAALSYCWGTGAQTMTTSATLSSYIKSLPSDVSNTIKDAITVCRKLGTRFLWVDALCIIQDDDDDKADQLAAMGTIYKQAHFTIAAAGASMASEGFLSYIDPKDDHNDSMASLPFYVDESTTGNIYVREHSLRFVSPDQTQPLFYRAWTLQEMLLSPRLLVFDSHQLLLKCHTQSFEPVGPKTWRSYEEYSIPNMPETIFEGDSELVGVNVLAAESKGELQDLSALWSSIVENYSQRDLTFFTDRLPALAGIASELSKIYGERYLAGFWKISIIRHLGWKKSSSHRLSRLCNNISDDEPAGALSWSWATMPFPVTLGDVCEPEARLLDCHIEPVYDNVPYGQIKRAILVLEALVLTITPAKSDPPICLGRSQCSCSLDPSAWKCSGPTVLPEGDISLDFRKEVGNEGVRLVFLGYTEWGDDAIFLVVEPTTGEYVRRIGHAELRDPSKRVSRFLTSREKEVILLE